MAKIDLTKFLGNNKKAIASAAVATITPALLKEAGVKQGDQIVITKLPANVLVTKAYTVVEEGATGLKLSIAFNSETITADLGVVATKAEADVEPQITKNMVDVVATVTTLGSTATGKAYFVIEFVELNGYMGTFLG